MNVLIVSSICLQRDSSEKAVDVGSESLSTHLTINPLTARVLYRSDRIKELIETINHNSMSYSPQKSILSLRQLVSGFDGISTFLYARASHEEFDVDQLMPATVFTICDYSHNQGYGSAANSSGKIASRFLQALAVSVNNQQPVNLSSALRAFNNAQLMKEPQTSSSSLAWKSLPFFVQNLTDNLDEERPPSPGVLATKVNFSAIADEACKAASLENLHIKKDVHLRLQTLYSERRYHNQIS